PRIRAAVRGLMWQHVGLVRDERGLEHALAELDCLEHEAGASERSLLLVARLIATAALERAESRGGHWRADHPDTDPAQQFRRFVRPPPVPCVVLPVPARRAA